LKKNNPAGISTLTASSVQRFSPAATTIAGSSLGVS